MFARASSQFAAGNRSTCQVAARNRDETDVQTLTREISEELGAVIVTASIGPHAPANTNVHAWSLRSRSRSRAAR